MSKGKGGKPLVFWAVSSGSKDVFEAVVAAIFSHQVCSAIQQSFLHSRLLILQ